MAEGETFGLVGESGSGKSTVLRAMSGLNADWTGAIEIGGTQLGRVRGKPFYERDQLALLVPYVSLHPRPPCPFYTSHASYQPHRAHLI